MTRYEEEDTTWRPSAAFIAANMVLEDIKTPDEAVEYFNEWWKNPLMHRVGEAPDVSGITDDDIRRAFEWAQEKQKSGKYPCFGDGEVIW